MRFSTALSKGTLIRRYKRFLADVTLDDGTQVTAHCPNTGSMESCYEEGSTVWLSPSENPERKLKWTWEFTATESGLIGVNTSRPNEVMAEAVKEGKIPELAGYSSVRREVKYSNNSRIDLFLEAPGKKNCYVEIKNTTLRRGNKVLFPDAVTARGLKHLKDLSEMVKEGHRSVMVFFVNRADGESFSPAGEIDPKYAAALKDSIKNGVEVLAIRAVSSPEGITTGSNIPVKI